MYWAIQCTYDLINPINRLAYQEHFHFIEGQISVITRDKIVHQMQFNETIQIINGGAHAP